MRLRMVALAMLLAGCAAPAGAPVGLGPDYQPTMRAGMAPDGVGADTRRNWPVDDGCAGAAVSITLPPGMVVDRFGAEGGRFLSTPDESFGARAMPYVCKRMAYTVYRLKKPVAAEACRAAAWFDQPGGAVQFKVGKPISALLADGVMEADWAATLRAGDVCR